MLEKIKTNIKSILFSKQFKMFLLLGLFSFVIFSFGIDTTFAVTTPDGADKTSDEAKLANDLLGFLQYIAGIAGGLIGGLTALLSILLNPSWVNGTLFEISEYIRQAWVFVSNVVYLIFAGLLIAISFANIVGKGTGDFELKTALPKFVVGLLIVPFSWFIVQFVISMSSILAVSVYAWPIETFSDKLSNIENEIEWCSSRTMTLQGKISEDNTNASNSLINTDPDGFFFCNDNPIKKMKIKEILNPEKGNIGSIIGLYSFGIIDVGSLDEFQKDDAKDIKTIFSLSAKVLFDVTFVFVYLVLLAALFMAMFARVIVLWIYMIISPIFGLLYFLGKGKVKELDNVGFKDFLALAMVPVYVSAALSFGLMFLLIIGEGGKETNYGGDSRLSSVSAPAATSADKEYNMGITKIIVKGPQANSSNKNSFLYQIAGGALGTLGYLMLKIFGLAFLWMAVIAALKQSAITSKLVTPFESFGREVGKFAMESPKFIPIPGTSKLNGSNGNLNAGSLRSFGSQSMRILGDRGSSDGSNLANKIFGGEETKAITSELKKIREETNSGKKIDLLRDLLTNFEEQKTFLEKITMANELAATGKFSKEVIQEIRDSENPEDYAEAISKANNELGDGSLLGEKNTTPKRAKEIMGSKPSGSGETDSSGKAKGEEKDFSIQGMSGIKYDQEKADYTIASPLEFAKQLKSMQERGDIGQQTYPSFKELLQSKGLTNDEGMVEKVIEEIKKLETNITEENKKFFGNGVAPSSGTGDLDTVNNEAKKAQQLVTSVQLYQDNPTSSTTTNPVDDPVNKVFNPLGDKGTENKQDEKINIS